MKIDFCFGYPFTKTQCKRFGIKDAKDLGGFYIYNYDKAYINIGSILFNKNSKETIIQKIVTRIAIHETLHKVIYEITGIDANRTEEKFVTLIEK